MSLRRIALATGIAVASLVLLSTAALAGFGMLHDGSILPGVSIAGVDVGGMSAQQARRALADTVTARESDVVTLTLDNRATSVAPSDIGLRVDLDTTIEHALEEGRRGGLLSTAWGHAESLWRDVELSLETTHDDDALDEAIATVVAEFDRPPSIGRISVDPDTLEVRAQMPRDGITVQQDATRDRILEGLAEPGPFETELPADISPTPVSDDDVQEVADQAERAVAAPLTLSAIGESVTLQPEDLAPMIALGRDPEAGSQVRLVARPRVVRQTFRPLASRFQREAQSASFDAPRAPSTTLDAKTDVTWSPRPADVSISEAVTGTELDMDRVIDQLSELLAEGEREARLRLRRVDPDLTTKQARRLGIDQLISTFTTYHDCCQARVDNIQRLADMVDQTLVRPGERFSINQISGERTCTKGFQPAGMILNGEIVDVCGGGVSQFGTTTVNAVFFAGLEPDAYQPHSLYISRYPMGREATLNYPSPDIDVRFTNDTDHGILVRTSYTSTSITVSFYGHVDHDTVSAIHGTPGNYKPYPTEYRENKSLPPGSSRTIQSGSNGFRIAVTRVVRGPGDRSESDDWSNTYSPQKQIIERNTSSPPPPPPRERDREQDRRGNRGGDG
jgi:vancomycin resistance protein YoaR